MVVCHELRCVLCGGVLGVMTFLVLICSVCGCMTWVEVCLLWWCAWCDEHALCGFVSRVVV